MQADPDRARTSFDDGEESTAVTRAKGDGDSGGAVATATEDDQTTEMLQLLRGVVGRLDKLEESQAQIQKQLKSKKTPKTVRVGSGTRLLDAHRRSGRCGPIQTPRRPTAASQYFGLRHADMGAYEPGISGLQRLYAVERPAQAAQEAPQPPAAPAPQPQMVHVQHQQQQGGAFRYPDARLKKLTIRPFEGKELYVGLGSDFLNWELLGHYLSGTAERYYNKQVDSWWNQYPSLQYVMEKMLDAFKTNITPVQAMKLFTAPNDGKGS
ncbi:hypothetical protein PF008_g17113 [Phytophthora fragariae]|uniref:RxLR effector protein n=1 Tax=Phytophthora fragariae TaxID=53985 RepID=A0A6G0R958_9STRA|nr:hypothetical protein PF008_g17113 [Phytophthora fragariae]